MPESYEKGLVESIGQMIKLTLPGRTVITNISEALASFHIVGSKGEAIWTCHFDLNSCGMQIDIVGELGPNDRQVQTALLEAREDYINETRRVMSLNRPTPNRRGAASAASTPNRRGAASAASTPNRRGLN